jgi:hypothetical protein
MLKIRTDMVTGRECRKLINAPIQPYVLKKYRTGKIVEQMRRNNL